MIAYYLQNRRADVLDRARAIIDSLEADAVVLSPRPAPFGWPTPWTVLADDSPGPLATWLLDERPGAVVVDGTAEHLRVSVGQARRVAAIARPGGDPGDRGPASDLADALLAPWTAAVGATSWPHDLAARTIHLGAIGSTATGALSRRSTHRPVPGRGPWRCLSIAPTAAGPDPRDRRKILTETPGWQWWFGSERDLLDEGPVWDTLVRCDVLVCAATATNFAAAAAAQVPAVLVLPARPSPEELFLAEAARRTAPVVVVDHPPAARQWRTLLTYARGLDGREWTAWAPQDGLAELRRLLCGEPGPRPGITGERTQACPQAT